MRPCLMTPVSGRHCNWLVAEPGPGAFMILRALLLCSRPVGLGKPLNQFDLHLHEKLERRKKQAASPVSSSSTRLPALHTSDPDVWRIIHTLKTRNDAIR